MPRSKLLITLGLILLMTLSVSVAYADHHTAAYSGEGTAVISDAAASSDKVTYSLAGVTALDADHAYEGWLIDSGSGDMMSTGVMSVIGGKISHSWTSPDGDNLLAMYDSVAVTVEELPDDDEAPSETKAFSGAISSDAIMHIRHLIVASPGGGDSGLLTQLQAQIGMAMAKIAEAQAADEIEALKAATLEAVDIIDADDGIVELAHEAEEHADLAADAAGPAENSVRTYAKKVIKSSGNAEIWALDAKAQTVAVIAEDDIDTAKVLLNIVNGRLAAAQDGTATEDGAAAAYKQAQMMATIALTTDGPPKDDDDDTLGQGPVTGDTAVPAAMQLMLLTALALIIGGGALLYRTRRQGSKA